MMSRKGPARKLPPLPPGWQWALRVMKGACLTDAARLMTREYDCFVYLEADLQPGLYSLRISTGVAPAAVVAAVLKANGIR